MGSAYRAGFALVLARDPDVVVSMDVDLSHDPAVLPQMLRLLDAGADAVIGSRYVPGGATSDWPLHRRLLSRWGNRYTSLVLGLQLRDCTSGYRAYRAEALRAIEPATTERRGIRVPHRTGPTVDRPGLPGDGDADRVRRPPLRAVEDVGAHHRRVDAAGDPMGRARSVRRAHAAPSSSEPLNGRPGRTTARRRAWRTSAVRPVNPAPHDTSSRSQPARSRRGHHAADEMINGNAVNRNRGRAVTVAGSNIRAMTTAQYATIGHGSRNR